MLIEPNTIETPFLKRMLKTSFKLYKKNITAYMLWAVFVFVISFISINIPNKQLQLMFDMFFGYIVFTTGVELSANIDFGSFNLNHFYSYIKRSVYFCVESIKRNIAIVAIIYVMMLVVESFLKSSQVPSDNILLDSYFNMSKIIFWGLVLTAHPVNAFSFSLLRMYDMSFEAAEILSTKGMHKNNEIQVFLNFMAPLAAVLSPFYSFFVGLIFLLPFFPILLYVMFREIFLGKKDLEKQEAKEKITLQKPIVAL